jgi:hypothetical protein
MEIIMATKTTYTLLRDLVSEGDKKDKVPPQVKVIVAKLKKFGLNKPVSGEDLTKALEADANKEGGLQTRQPPARILSYYRSRMPEDLVKVESIKEATPAKAKDGKSGGGDGTPTQGSAAKA